MMPGFKSRLAQELKSLLSLPKYAGIKISQFKLHQPPAQPNLTTWLGQLLKDENMNLKPVLRSRSRLEPPFLGWSRGRLFCWPEPEPPFLRRLRLHLFGKQKRKALLL